MNLIKQRYDRIKKKRRNKLYNLKQNIARRREKKYIAYIFRSNKNLYAQLVDEGKVIAVANTVKSRKSEKITKTLAVPEMSKRFFDQITSSLKDVNIKQIVYYTRENRFAGNIKSFINNINTLFHERENVKI